MDALWQMGTGGNLFYLHFEPQGYLDGTLPARMLRYRADTWEYTLSKGQGTPSIYQVVLFIFPENENRTNRIKDIWDADTGIDYSYRVIRTWEQDKKTIMEKKLLALYPLLPLMYKEAGETLEQVMELTVKAIETVENIPLRSDLYATTSILAEKKYTAALIRKFIRREMLMESELLKEWTAEERREAAAEAAEVAAKEATEVATINTSISIVIALLEDKFDIAPRHVKDKMQKINDPEILKTLSKKVMKVTTLEEFEQHMEKMLQQLFYKKYSIR